MQKDIHLEVIDSTLGHEEPQGGDPPEQVTRGTHCLVFAHCADRLEVATIVAGIWPVNLME